MRVLCLHGKGTSGTIFKSQTTTFRNRLPSILNAEFDFIDGPFHVPPAPGVDLFYSHPYFAFWKGDTLEEIQAAQKWLINYISKSGPYDAIMMFSQGCALGASVLLQYEKEKQEPPPFKAAIFICGGLPLSYIESIGFHIPQKTRKRDLMSRKHLSAQADASAILEKGTARWTATVVDGSEDDWRGEIQGGPCQISIPTIHVYGENDPRYVAGVQLSGLCDVGKRKVYNHGGGHEIPRGEVVSRKIAELVTDVLRDC